MGEVIRSTASIERIAADIQISFTRGVARGGEIEGAVKHRLEEPVAAIDACTMAFRNAERAASIAFAALLAADHPADNTVGAVRDEMWNALGRPLKSPLMDGVYPDGIGTYTQGDPRDQPLLMEVLAVRIKNVNAPQWSQDKRLAWISAIDAARETLADAVGKLRPLEAARFVAEAALRVTIKNSHASLVALKRDLKNLGMTEAQIHEIIPDASKPQAKPTT